MVKSRETTQRQPIILGIETSCDETAASLFCGSVEAASVVSSQIHIHKKYGGVVPEVASRNHTMDLPIVVGEVVKKAWSGDKRQILESILCKKHEHKTDAKQGVLGFGLADIDFVAATYGAGLSGALLCGLSFGKALAYTLGVPFVPVNHIQAHIDANYIGSDLKPPFLAVVVSGGHTSIVSVEDYNRYEEIVGTVDDACGEAFDKLARVLGLGYPGGKVVEERARMGTPCIQLFKNDPKQMKQISFSGLKTAAINVVHNAQQKGVSLESLTNDLCASFLQEAVGMVVRPTLAIAKSRGCKTVVLAGGVSANLVLRQVLREELQKIGATLWAPPIQYCTDNASMICMRAYNRIVHGAYDGEHKAWLGVNANSALRIGEN
ncbi:MAG: tRNA (adenosine(37)-N6)-threonylcarbamoyltransferase complex transferase subunit TsaD [Firmicutes bacterium]|nr:tRNA (adenosine(37)-N6)-threonylcarbamoyltransferase complex transferase subunit TsaD [Bacillota bacterium]